MIRWKAAAAHVVIIACVYGLCPVGTSGDSRWTVPVALNLLEHGSTSLEPYAAIALDKAEKSVECIPQPGRPSIPRALCPDGKIYDRYPDAVSVIETPFLPPL